MSERVSGRGPCVVCGATGYPLSVGGPSICPSCDCGIPVAQVRLERALADCRAERDALLAWAREAYRKSVPLLVHGSTCRIVRNADACAACDCGVDAFKGLLASAPEAVGEER